MCTNDYVPLVAAYKSLDTRHLTHLSERWTTDRTDGLHHFFFNGIGYESWESVWSAQKLSASSSGSVRQLVTECAGCLVRGVYNKFTPFHGEMLRRMATIFRNMEGLTAVGQWLPHVPFTLYPGVFASEFRNETHSFFTLVNRDDEHKYGEQMRVPCTAASRFFDVYRGHELRHPCSGSLATLNFAMVRRQQTNVLGRPIVSLGDISNGLSRCRRSRLAWALSCTATTARCPQHPSWRPCAR